MKLCIVAVGRARNAPEDAQTDDYLQRARALGTKLGFTAIESAVIETSRAANAEQRKAQEAARIATKIPKGAAVIALDETGKAAASEPFAKLLTNRRDQGQDIAFVIGGPDGLDSRFRVGETLSFGPQTWPHMLVRVMLAEQIYRAMTIIAGHPYHRR